MLHLGDITKINGYTVPIVDVVVGGSPCQDLSVAGKRAGLDGERSGLFMEQLRIIKEMRERDRRNGRSDEHIRPRYMVWENVPGAFSSNKAEDFRIVLEETAKVIDKDAVIPMPDKGKWTTSGCIMGDGWSIAWRVCDAQFYGVPQRRRRIALIADFGGHSAPEILFVRKSVSRDSEQSQPQRKETTPDATRGTGADDRGRNSTAAGFCPEQSAKTRGIGYEEETSPTLRSNVVPAVTYCVDQGGGKSACNVQEGQAPTLTCTHGGEPVICYSKSRRAQTNTDYETWKESDVANTLNAFDVGDKRTTEPVVAIDRSAYNQGKNAKFDIGIDENGITYSLVAKGPSAVAYGIGSYHSNAWNSDNPHSGVYVTNTAKTLDSMNCGYPACNQGGTAIVEKIIAFDEGTRFMVLAPVVSSKKGMHEKVFDDARKSGYVRVRVDGIMYDINEKIELDKQDRKLLGLEVAKRSKRK